MQNSPSIVKHPANSRGTTNLGWLQSRHSFSFGEYYDADHMSFRSLRVINDDIVEAGQGFGKHPHRDAEIFSYVLEGELEHQDSMGNGRIIKAGDLQYMSAGRGVVHSEFNPSQQNRVHFLQIWLMPNVSGGEPRYAEKSLAQEAKPNALTLLLSDKARDGAIEMRTEADVYLGQLDAGKNLTFHPQPNRGQWIHVITGELNLLHENLLKGDGISLENIETLEIKSHTGAQFLLFDLK